MKRTTACLFVTLLIAAFATYVVAQQPKPSTSPTTPDSEKPKSEVDRAMEQARSRGEIVMGTCVEDCGDFDREAPKEFERGRAIRLVKPAYPAIARGGGAQGEVRVQVLIGFEGEVVAASVLSGHPLLHSVAAKAARESLFTPTKFEGKPVKVVGVLLYNFIAP